MPYREGKQWRGSVMVGGVRSTAIFDTKGAARRWEDRERSRLKNSSRNKTATDLLTLCNKYCDYVEPRLTPKTIWEKKTLCKTVLAEWGNIPVDSISPEMVSGFISQQAQEHTNNIANRQRKNLLAMWNWGQKLLSIVNNPLVNIDPLPHTTKVQYTPPQKDVLQVLAATTREERIFLNCYLQTGARKTEIFSLTWEDVNFEAGTIVLKTRKTRGGVVRRDVLPMSRELREDLRWWWENRPVKDPVWVFVYNNPDSPWHGKPFSHRQKFMKGLCKRAGVKPFGFHALRRYVASILADKEKVSSKVIQRLLRHQSIATTDRYIQRINSDLQATVDLLKTTPDSPCKITCKKDGKSGEK